MTSENISAYGATMLRSRVEECRKERQRSRSSGGSEKGEEDTRALIQELQIYQIELEIQNEELRRTRGELEALRDKYFDLYNLAPVGYFTISERGMIMEANHTAARLLGVARGALAMQPLVHFILPADQDIYNHFHKELFETAAPQIYELRILRADADPFWARIEAAVRQDTERGEALCRAVMSDITEEKRYQESLKKIATHDRLTGLLNRYALEEMLSRSIARANRGVVSSLLYTDLDNFKEVNDELGHRVGDDVLITLADLIKAAIRMEDIVFRLGGDEFAVLLDGMDCEEALNAAERLRVAIEGCRFELAGRIFPLSLSIGLIEINGALTMGELLSDSDAAMYRAKRQGKNRIVIAFEKGE